MAIQMITLKLEDRDASFERVQAILGLDAAALDSSFGLICLSPEEHLYAVRTMQPIDVTSLALKCPAVLESYEDVRISALK